MVLWTNGISKLWNHKNTSSLTKKKQFSRFIPKITSGKLTKHHTTWQKRLLHILHHRYLHYAFVTFLVVDIFLVVLGIAIEMERLSSELNECKYAVQKVQKRHLNKVFGLSLEGKSMEKVEERLGLFSTIILGSFLFELVLLFIAAPFDFLRNPLHLLDLFVVLASLAFETIFMENPEGGLLVLARVWRFARIGHGFYEYERETIQDRMVNRFRLQLHGSESTLVSAEKILHENLSDQSSESDVVKVCNDIHRKQPLLLYTLIIAAASMLHNGNGNNLEHGTMEVSYPARNQNHHE